MVEFMLNGSRRTFDGDPDMPLLWYLRDEAGLTGTKYGCGGGFCGACTVHVNGQAFRACQTTMSAVAGQTIVTIEGLGSGGKDHPVQRAWMEANVAQCGYCQTGQIMQAAALLAGKPHPTDAQIDEAMAGNICRCGTYQRIVAAVQTAAGTQKGGVQ
jgi:isoquinoline 1-oxidoreductase alpha subunit